MHAAERQLLSRCEALSWPPLSSGRWIALRYQAFVFVGYSQLLTLDPLTGDVQITQCDDTAYLPRCHGEKLQCTPILRHMLKPLESSLAPVHGLTYLGQVSKSLSGIRNPPPACAN